jgi:putative flippase GtrA
MNLKELMLRYRNLILYGIIGLFCAGTDFVIYYLLTSYLKLYYLAANVISVISGITISFLLNRSINFKVKDNAIKRYSIFFTVGISGLIVSSILLVLFIEIFYLKKVVSKLLSIFIVVILQYITNKNITFRKNYEN